MSARQSALKDEAFFSHFVDGGLHRSKFYKYEVVRVAVVACLRICLVLRETFLQVVVGGGTFLHL